MFNRDFLIEKKKRLVSVKIFIFFNFERKFEPE
jgi:hypothetical protein